MSRRKARETAMQMLFQMDIGKNDWDMACITLENAHLGEENSLFVSSLVQGAHKHLKEIDALIALYAKEEWELDRLAAADRNILRLAIYELRYHQQTPENVIINEAVELAKKFGTETSSAFINGLLDKAK
jgi:N utilization substance protein B